MSPAYPHLLVNHLPVVVALVAAVLLGVAVWRRTLVSVQYGLYTQIAVAVLAIVAYVTGNFAPAAVQHLVGVNVDGITHHQITAMVAMISSVLVGLLCCIPLYLTSIATQRGVIIGYFVLSLALVAVFALTASTGGAIRHTELDLIMMNAASLPSW